MNEVVYYNHRIREEAKILYSKFVKSPVEHEKINRDKIYFKEYLQPKHYVQICINIIKEVFSHENIKERFHTY